MAILTGALSFTGSLQGLSAYKMRGTNKIILRRKGGATKERIQKHPSFEIVRRNNEEWKACIKAVAGIRQIMHPVRHLADYNFSATLNGLCKRIQAADKMNAFGFRSVLLSQAGYALQGFQLNKQNNFDNLLQHPLSCTLNRDTATATILLPQLMPNINFFNPKQLPLYRFVFVLGAAMDMVYNAQKNSYQPAHTHNYAAVSTAGDWHIWKQGSTAQTLTLTIANWEANSPAALMLWAGIEFGVPVSDTLVQPVKYAGCAKLLKMG